jgi:hypothetical protein
MRELRKPFLPAAAVAVAALLVLQGCRLSSYARMQNRLNPPGAGNNLKVVVKVLGNGADVEDMHGNTMKRARGGFVGKLRRLPGDVAYGTTWGAYDPKSGKMSFANLRRSLHEDARNLWGTVKVLGTLGVVPPRNTKTFSERVGHKKGFIGKAAVVILYLPANVWRALRDLILDDLTPARGLLARALLEDGLLNASGTTAYVLGGTAQAVYDGTVRIVAVKVAGGNQDHGVVQAVDNFRAYTINLLTDSIPGTLMSNAVHRGNAELAPLPYFGHMVSSSPLTVWYRDPETGEIVTFEIGDLDALHRFLHAVATAGVDYGLGKVIYEWLNNNSSSDDPPPGGSRQTGGGGGMQDKPQ